MTAHKHAALMLQYAQDAMETDKPWEHWEVAASNNKWGPLFDHPRWSQEWYYRRKPQTLTYTVTIPEPLREAPEVGTKYFFPDLCFFELFSEVLWDGDSYDHYRLKRGLCFATKEYAIAAAKAMLPVKEEA